MIEFLQDYVTEANPPERFAKGQQVTRSEESELYFVGRGLAGFIHDGKLVDADYRPITVAEAVVEIVQPGNRRLEATVRAGEVMTGQPPRASSGPGVPFVETTTGTAGVPDVVLEAEIERLKGEIERLGGELGAGADLFRDMNNCHVEAADKLRADLTAASSERDRAIEDARTATERAESAEKQLVQLRDELAATTTRVDSAEQQIAAQSDEPGEKPARQKRG